MFIRFFKLLLLLLLVYSFSWYFLGLYVKIKVRPILSEAMHINDLHYESIDLSGYPLSFKYLVKSPKFYLVDDGVETLISLEKIGIETDVLLKKIDVSFRDEIFMRSDDNKRHYLIKLHDVSNLELLLSKSILVSNFFGDNTDISVKRFSYKDDGYEVTDKNLDKVISVSKANEFTINIQSDKGGDQKYDVIANLNSVVDMIDHNLKGDVEYLVRKHGDEGFELKVNRLEINSNNHHLKIIGNLNYYLSTKNSTGTIDINIKNFESLMKTCSAFLYADQVKLLKNIILRISGNSGKHKIKDMSFSISGTENGIKYGNVVGFDNILALVMERN